MIENIHSISENLWDKTKASALVCLENYLNDNTNFSKNISANDFEFKKDKQSLIFWYQGDKTFIIRSTYNLSLHVEKVKLSGFYSLDLNEQNEIIDDWLVFN